MPKHKKEEGEEVQKYVCECGSMTNNRDGVCDYCHFINNVVNR